MSELLLNYIVQAILGGASGYITNDYAINMLFKEYTPLKLGGVIKKSRVEFIENLSTMIENDIINKEKLHEIFNSREFKTEFEKLACDFYEYCLYEAAGHMKFSDIDGFSSSMKGTDNYVQKILGENLEGLIGLIIENFDAAHFLTSTQTEKISESLYRTLKDYIENTDVLENILKYLYENNKELKLSEIFDSNMGAIDCFIDKFLEIAANTGGSLEILAGFDGSINGALDIFYGKQIKDAINFDKKLINSFISWMTDSDTVYKLCRSLFSYGKTVDKSLYSLIDPAFESSLRAYIEDNIPFATEQLVNYVQKNSMLIDRIIEDSIDEVIDESQGLKTKLLNSIKNIYFDNLRKKYSLVDKIISFIRQFADSEKLSGQISERIIRSLDTVTLSDIITGAESNFKLDTAYDFVADFLNKNKEDIFKNIESTISHLHVKDILPGFVFSSKKLLSTGQAQEFLKNILNENLETILSKELKELAAEEKLDYYVIKAAEYLKEQYCENENSIKFYLSKVIKNVEINVNTLKNEELNNFIYQEFYEKYKAAASKLKGVNLSFALDKLNSIENLSKNSSETLRKYMVNNTDTILRGSIKGIVTDNLNKLSDDELVDFANDFIGRELKPIMFFGGALGVIAGLILAAFQNSPLDPSEINTANMATYAFVGFITNVIAINMLFKPYKEIKFLSKIPLFNNFSLGYLVKNQKNFAKSTAYYIDTSLLSKKSINEMFEKHKDNIKLSFIKSIAENDYATLSSLLVKNKAAAVSGTFSFLKKNILKSLSAFSSGLYERLSRTKLSSLLTGRNIDNFINYAGENIKAASIKNKIYSIISSDKKLKAVFSKEPLIRLLNVKSAELYDKTMDFVEPSSIKNEFLKYNDKYVQHTNKTIGEIFNINDMSGFSKNVNKFVFSDDFKNSVSLAAVTLFNKLFDRNKSFGQLFQGKLKTYTDRNLPRILENVTQRIKDNLSESKVLVSTKLRSELKNNLGFIESGVYALIDGDEIIDSLVSKIMTEKLPLFMDVKKNEINKIMADFIDDRFYKTQVEVLYVNLNKLQINEMVENYLGANKEKLEIKIQNLTEVIYNKLKNKNIKSILEFFYLVDLKSFTESHELEINTFANLMHLYLTSRKDKINIDISDFTRSFAEEFMDLKFSQILSCETKDDIGRIIDNLTSILKKNDGERVIIKSFIEKYMEYHSNTNPGYYIDKDEFLNSTEMFVQSLLMNDEIEKSVKETLYKILEDAAETNFSFVDAGTKEYAVNAFVDASIEGLRRNLDDILKSVEFDKIAQEEIEKMEPAKIHQMFNSFGGKYFKKLMLYGFGGFVFGINMYVGFTLTGFKILSETIKKKTGNRP